jgi:hypothetical protein
MFHNSADDMILTRIARALAVLTLAFIAVSANAQQQSAQTTAASADTTHSAIPDDNLAYPVLITVPNFSFNGSGFYLNTDNGTFLVTAKHVLFEPKTEKEPNRKLRSTVIDALSYLKEPSDLRPNIFEFNLSVLEIKAHPTQDVAVVKIAAIAEKSAAGAPGRATLLPGVLTKATSVIGILDVGPDVIKPFDQILVGNDVIVFGYPTSLGLKELAQLDPMRPLLRRGLVAGQNLDKRSIVLDCPVYPGNSGGPVIEVDPEGLGYRLWVVGVVSEFVPFADSGKYISMLSNSGYSIATPMGFVLELTQ